MSDDAKRLLVPEVTVFVHPINHDVHPTYPPGFRWAVMVGGVGPTDLEYCVGAGHAPTADHAALIGESHGAAVVLGLRIMTVSARYATVRLDYDPVPAEADHRPLVKLGTPCHSQQ